MRQRRALSSMSLLVLDRADVAQGRVPSPSVVEHLDVLADCEAGRFTIGPCRPVVESFFSVAKKDSTTALS